MYKVNSTCFFSSGKIVKVFFAHNFILPLFSLNSLTHETPHALTDTEIFMIMDTCQRCWASFINIVALILYRYKIDVFT